MCTTRTRFRYLVALPYIFMSVFRSTNSNVVFVDCSINMKDTFIGKDDGVRKGAVQLNFNEHKLTIQFRAA